VGEIIAWKNHLVSSFDANGRPHVSAPRQTARARELRKEQTPAEETLWQLLRNRRLLRLKFRRQVPIGPYIADFYCHRYRLVIELDGPVHEERQQAAHDAERDLCLSALGFTILRFTNQRVFEEPEGVLLEIHGVVG
jgi:very-short-patch-repair endonuclease